MIRRLAPLAFLTMGMCAHLPAASCANADQARAVARLALQALDRACPIN